MIVCNNATGQIFVCRQCKKIHLEFGCLAHDFSSEDQLIDFLDFLEQIDGQHYEQVNKTSYYRRKILIPIPGTNFKMLFTANELDEMRELLKSFVNRNKTMFVTAAEIKANFSLYKTEHLN